MATRAFVLNPAMGWAITEGAGVEPAPQGLHMALLPTAAAPPVDADGMFGGLDLPTGVAVDAVGRVYVADVSAHAIKRYDPACPPDRRVEVLPCLGGDGPEVRNLREPQGLAVRGDDLIVVDAGNARVLAISLNRLALRATIGPIDDAGEPVKLGDPAAWKPWDVVADGRGCLYVSDRRGRVFRFNRRGRLRSSVTLPGAGEGPVSLAIACPPRLATVTKALFGGVELQHAPRTGDTWALLAQDAWLFVSTGDTVEFRTQGGLSERRIAVVRDVTAHEDGKEFPWPALTWSGPLQHDYTGPGSLVRLVTAARGGDLAPRVRVASSTGWQAGDWLCIHNPSREVARVIDVRNGALVLDRSAPAPWVLEGVRLSRITPLLAIADARPGEGALRVLAGDGAVLNASAARSDLAVFARYGGLAFGAEMVEGRVPSPPLECASERGCRCGNGTPTDLEAVLLATIGKKIKRIPDPAYGAEGTAYLGPLDSKIYQCPWHRILADMEIPQATRLTLDTLTSEIELTLDETKARASEWQRASLDGVFPDADRVPDRYLWDGATRDTLVQSGPGRYLYLRATLSGNGTATPFLRELRVIFPRRSYLEYLPAVYQEDAESRHFLDRFLSIFQTTFEGFDRELDAYARFLDPKGVPEDFIPWLASWVGLSLDWPWTPEERMARERALLERAPDLYRKRGTVAGLRDMILAYTGLPEHAVHIIEAFCARNWMWLASQGGRGSVLAGTCLYGRMQLSRGTALGEAPLDASGDPAQDPFAAYAHQFTVVVPAGFSAVPPLDGAVRRLVDQEKPAHTKATIYSVQAQFRVGIQSVIGVDTLIGTYPVTEVGRGRLGFDTVLTCPEPTGAEIGRTSRIGGSLIVA